MFLLRNSISRVVNPPLLRQEGNIHNNQFQLFHVTFLPRSAALYVTTSFCNLDIKYQKAVEIRSTGKNVFFTFALIHNIQSKLNSAQKK